MYNFVHSLTWILHDQLPIPAKNANIHIQGPVYKQSYVCRSLYSYNIPLISTTGNIVSEYTRMQNMEDLYTTFSRLWGCDTVCCDMF